MLRVGLVGAGRAGEGHAAAYRTLKDVRVTLVADAAAESARQVAARCGAKVAATPEALIHSPEVDVVDVCVPTFLHRAYVTQAAQAGKHVICEKPIALSLEDGQAMVEACRSANVRFFVGHVTRFLPEYRRMKALLDSGEYGRPLVAKTRRGGRFFPGTQGWIDDAAKSGSIVLEAMLHDFDVMRWFFGQPERVYCAHQSAEEPCHLEAAYATLHFPSGLVAMVEGNRIHNDRFYYTAEVFCSQGVLAFDSRSMAPLRVTGVPVNGNALSPVTRYESLAGFDQFEAELEHFAHCIATGEPPLVTPKDALGALAIGLAAVRSCQSGTPATL
jgi:UDP-N-acetylglucosamine 3-dehydrogenase